MIRHRRDPQFHCGTAGWQLPRGMRTTEKEASQLEQYSARFNAVEINSTFHRPHRPATFERWAATVPASFRFAVKMHRSITHESRLTDVRAARTFLDMVGSLGEKLGPILIQLPPSLSWSPGCGEFLEAVREMHAGEFVLEARHASWATAEAQHVLKKQRIAGVAADPPLLTDHIEPTGHNRPVYVRLHGAPRVYWSNYEEAFLNRLAGRLVAWLLDGRHIWVTFDNTAAGCAAANAHRLQELVGDRRG